jgi:hypothetical protein
VIASAAPGRQATPAGWLGAVPEGRSGDLILEQGTLAWFASDVLAAKLG